MHESSHIFIRISGTDRPGITAELTQILSQFPIEIVDIGQSVVHQVLSLSFLVRADFSWKDNHELVRTLREKTYQLGLQCEIQVIQPHTTATVTPHRYAVTVIGQPVSLQALSHITALFAQSQVNIEQIQRLSQNDLKCVELQISTPDRLDLSTFKTKLLSLASSVGVDVAIQDEGIYRKSKRLIVFDMDSTLIQAEVIDELAREKGVYDQVAAITHRAMKGELDFDQSLQARCALLSGLNANAIEHVYERIALTPGSYELIAVLKRLGYKIALISGGFTCIAEKLKSRLHIDYAYANQLEIAGELLTGKVIPPIVNAQRKADLVREIAQKEKLLLDQVIAVGDGANDIPMLESAGLGVAYNAKPLVQEKAHLALRQKSLIPILYLVGIPERDWGTLLNQVAQV